MQWQTTFTWVKKFGSGTIVNPSQVSSEQLKDSKLVTVLVPTGGLAEGEKLDIHTQTSLEKQAGIKFEKFVAGKLAASSILGGAVGTGVTVYASGADAGTAIDVIGGSVIGSLVGLLSQHRLRICPQVLVLALWQGL